MFLYQKQHQCPIIWHLTILSPEKKGQSTFSNRNQLKQTVARKVLNQQTKIFNNIKMEKNELYIKKKNYTYYIRRTYLNQKHRNQQPAEEK